MTPILRQIDHIFLCKDVQFNKTKTLLKSHSKHLSHLGAKHLAIFGSNARNQTKKESAIDILVDFEAKR